MSDEKEYRLIPFDADDESDRIRISDIISILWDARKTIFIITAVFVMYGIFRSLATPEEFTSRSTMMPNVDRGAQLTGSLQQFSGLLGGAGLDSGQGNDIDVTLYPEIIYSTPAMYDFIYTEIYSPQLDTTVTVKDYMLEYRENSTLVKVTGGLLKYTVHLPFTIVNGVFDGFRGVLGWILGSDEPRANDNVSPDQLEGTELPDGSNTGRKLTFEEYNFIVGMRDKIQTERNTDTGLFTITVSMPESEISAQLNDAVITYLKDYITEYRTEKLVRDLEFINERYKESEKEFFEIQEKLADFRDRNVNIATARARSEEQRLQSEYQLQFDIFNSIAQQREETRINLEEETPIFNILEPVTIPPVRSKPARGVITVLYTFFGFLIAVGWVFIRPKVFVGNR
ncbi:MAG: Wzz/FepE/Etk N-terminal domain-containing protein [Balneolaceae bacterium]